MSLLATASPWDSSDSSSIGKKRMPTMNIPNRRTIKNRDQSHSGGDQSHSGGDQEDNQNEGFQELNPARLGGQIPGQPLSIDDTKRTQESNSLKINGLLNKITSFDSENGRLADFKPPPNPTLTKMPQQMSKENPLVPALPQSREPAPNPSVFYRPFTGPKSSEFSNYLDAHTNTISYGQNAIKDRDVPYYAKKEDRLNYVVHMLEEMQKEKTNHVTEEFVLYTMLGVFIIYIVDGFARIGTKYVR